MNALSHYQLERAKRDRTYVPAVHSDRAKEWYELYKQHGSCKRVAFVLGNVCEETVRRTFQRGGYSIKGRGGKSGPSIADRLAVLEAQILRLMDPTA